MKVVHIVPGSGGTFYCQNCLRDSALVKALRQQGHDVMMVPLYLPFFTDEPEISQDVPVFFGGINVYLQQKLGLFRKTPRWLDRLFDTPFMLKFAAQREGSTQAAGLGPMTLSMMNGKDGNQRKEVERLIKWLAEQEKPDIVHISNSLLIGLAGELKAALNVPVVCTLQDEDTWLDAIDKPHDELCWQAMADRVGDVDAFVSVSEWYADKMCDRMSIARDAIRVINIGIDLNGVEQAPLSFDPPTIGYLSKMTPSLGLGLLVDAFIELKKNPKLKDLRLRATGGITGDDKHFISKLQKKLASHGYNDDAEFIEDFGLEERREFLKSLSLMSVPAMQGEAFGLYIIEALAHGVPVVQPDRGAFPELIEATGGGVVFSDEKSLASSLGSLLLDPAKAKELGSQGRKAVMENFGIDKMADNMIGLYQSLIG